MWNSIMRPFQNENQQQKKRPMKRNKWKSKKEKKWKKNIDNEQLAKQNKHRIDINADWMRYIKWINIQCIWFVSGRRVHRSHFIPHRIKIIFLFSFGIWTVKMALGYSCATAKQFHLFDLSESLFSKLDRSIYLRLQWIKLNLLLLLWAIEFGFSLNFYPFVLDADGCIVIPRNVCKQSVTKFA